MDFMIGCGILKYRTISFGTQQLSPDRITFCCITFYNGFVVAVVVSMLHFCGSFITTRGL